MLNGITMVEELQFVLSGTILTVKFRCTLLNS